MTDDQWHGRTVIADALRHPVWIARADGSLAYANPFWREYTGLASPAAGGIDIAAAIHPDDAGEARDRFARAVATGDAYDAELRLRRADGVHRWHLLQVAPMSASSGEIDGWAGASTDIDDRRQGEEQAARLTAIMTSSRDAIIGRRLDGAITDWNPSAEALYGWTNAEIVGRDIALLVPPDRAEEIARDIARLALGEEIAPYETERVRKDGARINVEAAVSPIKDAAGAVIGVSGIDRNLNDRREERARQHAFLEAVSHDLKNPLAAIRAQTQLLDRRLQRAGTVDGAWLETAVHTILDASRRLELQLDELQDALRLRSGHPLELRAAPTDLVELARAAATSGPSCAHRVNVAVDDEPLVGNWDGLRVRRVFDNLIGNAIKYSDAEREVAVELSRTERNGGAWAVARVRDEGVGIPAADLPHIFERYRRGSNVGERFVGAGIGLSGAKQIIEQHGGAIAVESREGLGSIFTVTLPLLSGEPGVHSGSH